MDKNYARSKAESHRMGDPHLGKISVKDFPELFRPGEICSRCRPILRLLPKTEVRWRHFQTWNLAANDTSEPRIHLDTLRMFCPDRRRFGGCPHHGQVVVDHIIFRRN